MLEKVILEALGGKQAIEGRVRAELERLMAGGYLKPEDVERIAAESVAALASRAAEAGVKLQPLAAGAAKAVRDLLDVPSRSELEELRAALRARSESQPPR